MGGFDDHGSTAATATRCSRKHRGEREKAIKILAKSIYRQLRATGYDTREIVALSSELIGLITTEIKPDTHSFEVARLSPERSLPTSC